MLDRLLEWAFNSESDISEHLWMLQKLSTECYHVTELGVRSMVSSWAFLSGLRKHRGTLISVDIVSPLEFGINPEIVSRISEEHGVNFKFIQASSLDITLAPTDLLFIDTVHEAEQLRQELALHAMRARKYIVFHDTESCKVELQPVINEFLEQNKTWKKIYEYTVNNGIIVIQRQ